jgi:hypothetical protein
MDLRVILEDLGSSAPFDGEDVMAKKKRKKGSVSLRPVVDAIDDTITKLIRAKKKTSIEGRRVLNLKVRSMRSLRSEALTQCRALDIWIPQI